MKARKTRPNPNEVFADPVNPGQMVTRRQILRSAKKEIKDIDRKIRKLETLKDVYNNTLAEQVLWVCVQPERKIPYFKDYTKQEAVFVRMALMRIRKALYASNKIILDDDFVKRVVNIADSSEIMNDLKAISLAKSPSDNLWVEWNNLPLSDRFDHRGFLLQRLSGSESLYRASFYSRQNVVPQPSIVNGVLAEIDDVDRAIAGTINFSGVGIIFDPRGVTDLQKAQTAEDREIHDAIIGMEKSFGITKDGVLHNSFRYTATGPDVNHWLKMLRGLFEAPRSAEEVEQAKLQGAQSLSSGIDGQYKFLLASLFLWNTLNVTETDFQSGTKRWSLDVDIDNPTDLVRQQIDQVERVVSGSARSQSPIEEVESLTHIEFGKPPFILNGGHRDVMSLLMKGLPIIDDMS